MSDRNRTGGPDRGRRRFLKEAAGTVLGLGWGLPLLASGCGAAAERPGAGAPSKQWAMIVDVEKCRSEAVRRACIDACDREHNVPRIPDPEEEVKWIWEAEHGKVFPELVHRHTPGESLRAPVLVLCNHCANPPCTAVCPTGATWKRESDGIVMMDMHRCIGCRYCMAACPYGARSFNWRDPRPHVLKGGDGRPASSYLTRTRGVVEKCNFCVERVAEGKPPACVEVADSVEGGRGALVFGDAGDPASAAGRLLAVKRTVVRRSHLGTGPNVYYVV